MSAHKAVWADSDSMRRLCTCGWAGDWKDFDDHLPEGPTLLACLSVMAAIALVAALLTCGLVWISTAGANYRAEHAVEKCR